MPSAVEVKAGRLGRTGAVFLAARRKNETGALSWQDTDGKREVQRKKKTASREGLPMGSESEESGAKFLVIPAAEAAKC